jgi:hypothetical protein
MKVGSTMIRVTSLAIALCACGAEGSDDSATVQDGSKEVAADPLGVAKVTLGEATFEFEVECMFGGMLVRGPGEREDGTLAHLVATFNPEEPESADIELRIGTDRIVPADQIWVAGDYGHSASVTWESDGPTVRASAPFRDRESGDQSEVSGVLEISCPA